MLAPYLDSSKSFEAAKTRANRIQYICNNFGSNAKLRSGAGAGVIYELDCNPSLPAAAKMVLEDNNYLPAEDEYVALHKETQKFLNDFGNKYPLWKGKTIEALSPIHMLNAGIVKSDFDSLAAVKHLHVQANKKCLSKVTAAAKEYSISADCIVRALHASREEISGINIEKANRHEEIMRQPAKKRGPQEQIAV